MVCHGFFYFYFFKGPWKLNSYLALINSQSYCFLKFLLKCQPKSCQKDLSFNIARTLLLGKKFTL